MAERSKLSKLTQKKFPILLASGILFSCITLMLSTLTVAYGKKTSTDVLGANIAVARKNVKNINTPVITVSIEESPTNTPTPISSSPIPKRIKVIIATPTVSLPTPKIDNSAQYNAQKIDDTTWKVSNVANDDKMATTQELLNALNSYRGSNGLSNLAWDSKLTELAQSRVDLFIKNGSLDNHQGFNSYMDNGGFDKAGFNSLGENSAMLSGPMNGDRIIRNIFGADSSHDGNQLDNWSHVGLAINGNAVNVNFGKNKK